MRKLKVGIIGQGRSGRDIHALALMKRTGHYGIAAVSDPLEARRQKAEQEFGCDAYPDHAALLARKDLDLIVNAAPSHLHVPISLECLENGHNVLCEKPLARSAADVDRLIEATVRTGNVLAIFQQARFSPGFEKIREVVASGKLGRVVQASIHYSRFGRRWDWQTLKENLGGSLRNTGPHPLDQALQLFGADIAPEVACRMDRTNSYGNADDYVKLMLTGPGRPTVDVEISNCCAYPPELYRLQCSLGGIRGSDDRLEWKYYKPEEAPERQLITEPLAKADGAPAYCGEQLKWYEEEWELAAGIDASEEMADRFYLSLYDTLVHGRPLRITPQEVRQQIAVMERCFELNPEFGG